MRPFSSSRSINVYNVYKYKYKGMYAPDDPERGPAELQHVIFLPVGGRLCWYAFIFYGYLCMRGARHQGMDAPASINQSMHPTCMRDRR